MEIRPESWRRRSAIGANTSVPRCGEFDMTGSAEVVAMGRVARINLPGRIREHNRAGQIPTITANLVTEMDSKDRPTVRARLERLLLEARHGSDGVGDEIDLGDPRFTAASYSRDARETMHLAVMLQKEGWAEVVSDQGPRGHVHSRRLSGG